MLSGRLFVDGVLVLQQLSATRDTSRLRPRNHPRIAYRSWLYAQRSRRKALIKVQGHPGRSPRGGRGNREKRIRLAAKARMHNGVLRAVTSGHGGGDEAVMAAANPNNKLGIRPFAGALVLVAKCSGYPLLVRSTI